MRDASPLSSEEDSFPQEREGLANKPHNFANHSPAPMARLNEKSRARLRAFINKPTTPQLKLHGLNEMRYLYKSRMQSHSANNLREGRRSTL